MSDLDEVPEFPPRTDLQRVVEKEQRKAREGPRENPKRTFTEPPRRMLEMRQRLRKYGLFTPAGIADAMEAARSLLVPTDPATIMECGTVVRNGEHVRISVDIPLGVAYRCLRTAKARGISRMRLYAEIITYHVMAIQDADLGGVPALYADFLSPQGVEVLAKALHMALDKNGLGRKIAIEEYQRQREERKAQLMPRAYKSFSLEKSEPEPEPEIDLTPQEREEFSNW